MGQKKAFLLRISPDLWEELNRWSADELRSVNAQIEYVLRQALKRRKGGQLEEQDGAAAGQADSRSAGGREAESREDRKDRLSDDSTRANEQTKRDGWTTDLD